MKRDLAGPLTTLEFQGYEIAFHSHARAILEIDFPEALDELSEVLTTLTIPIEEIVASGGGEAKGTQRLRRGLAGKNWTKTRFDIRKTINNVQREAISHEVDHVRSFPDAGEVALEIEWNNKDPFFDRDLENFKRLHSESAISVGIIVTRGTALQDQMKELVSRFVIERNINSFEDLEPYHVAPTKRQREAVQRRIGRRRNPMTFREAWTDHFVNDKYGAATTHWRKLKDRVRRGVGNPCPLLLIGVPPSIVTFNEGPRVLEEVLEEDSFTAAD
jgi:hypothetical protein